jgi:hypothetical protein
MRSSTLVTATLAAGALATLLLVSAPAATATETAAVESTLYFGLKSRDGTGVSEQQWQSFLAEAITPRFPDGLTVFNAYGQGSGGAAGAVIAETTKVLVIVRPDSPEAAARLGEIKADFARRFPLAGGVFHTDAAVRIVD